MTIDDPMMGDTGNLQEVVATMVTTEVDTVIVIKEPMTMTTKVLAMPHGDATEDHQVVVAVDHQEMDRMATPKTDIELLEDVDAIRVVTPPQVRESVEALTTRSLSLHWRHATITRHCGILRREGRESSHATLMCNGRESLAYLYLLCPATNGK
jgi:hypothetical protein